MSNDPKQEPTPRQPLIYQIRLAGHLSDEWADRFEGLTITLEENGNTLLTGPLIDQAALFGLLKRVRDLGLPLISVEQVEHGRSDLPETQPNVAMVEKGNKNERKQESC